MTSSANSYLDQLYDKAIETAIASSCQASLTSSAIPVLILYPAIQTVLTRMPEVWLAPVDKTTGLRKEKKPTELQETAIGALTELISSI
jgi:hypothetical protein